jgi:3-oxoacyl-ACP reductase-like protein
VRQPYALDNHIKDQCEQMRRNGLKLQCALATAPAPAPAAAAAAAAGKQPEDIAVGLYKLRIQLTRL